MTIEEIEKELSKAAAEAAAHGYLCGMRVSNLAYWERRLQEAKAKEVNNG